MFYSNLTSLVLPSKRSQTSFGILCGTFGVGVVSLPKGATRVPGGTPCCEEPEPSL